MDKKEWIASGKAVLGLELGSTRIKATLIGEDFSPIASGSYGWENRYEGGYWTYGLDEVWTGVQAAIRDLKHDVEKQYGAKLTKLRAMGVSAMMHGYLAFDKEGKLLAPFRTWRNTTTARAAEELTGLFGFNIPQRWSIAHLYQAMLDGEEHVKDAAYLTTLAGYVHWKLTGEFVLGVGDASGVFPIDSEKNDYNEKMLALFEQRRQSMGYDWTLRGLLPKILGAGAHAGKLTDEGAKLLDPDGEIEAGVLFCPPEGDAGTGMAATNAVAPRTGNVSAGTSVFAMAVLEKELKAVHPEIDMVTTPSGAPVAMVHCNNCTNEINAWAEVFAGFAKAAGANLSMNDIYGAIFGKALEGAADCGGLVTVPYLSGEPVAQLEQGRPLMVRTPEAKLTFENFARMQLYAAVATLKMGMDKLTVDEGVQLDSINGHGGFFKTGSSGRQVMADALNVPVNVMKTAGEGGPWGMALLAAYMADETGLSLEKYLSERVFAGSESIQALPDAEGVKGFGEYICAFKAGLAVERIATEEL